MSLGGKGGGGGEQTQTEQMSVNVPDYLQGPLENLIPRIEQLSQEPFTAYDQERIAGLSPDELAAFEQVRGLQGAGDANMGQATGAASDILSRISGGISADDIQSRMNPFQQQVIDQERRKAVEQADIQRSRLGDEAARAGVFGGSRAGVAEAYLNRDLATQLGDIQATGSRDGYNNAINQFFNEQNLGLSSAGTLANLAGMSQNMQLSDAAALQGIGQSAREIDQSQMNFNWEEFMREENDPFMKNQYLLSSIASVLPGVSGRSSVMTGEGGGGGESIWGDVLGLAGTVAGGYFGGAGGAQAGGAIGSSVGGGFADGGLVKPAFSEGGLVEPLEHYRSAIFQNEHSGNPDYDARGNSSSALGAYQFMPSTWDEIATRNPELGLKTIDEYDGDLPSPDEQDAAFENYLGFLAERSGNEEDFTPEFAALAWNYGAKGAKEIMSAPPETPMREIIGSKAYHANRLEDKGVETASDMLSHFNLHDNTQEDPFRGIFDKLMQQESEGKPKPEVIKKKRKAKAPENVKQKRKTHGG